MLRADLLASRVPRYTSYPTAPHFHSGVNGNTYRSWLRQLPDGAPLSLYVHIPFCDTLCWFCGCHTKVVNLYSPVASYLELIRTELGLIAAITGHKHPVTHIHFGGGSPTLLKPEDFADITLQIRRSFPIAPDVEFAVEIDPRGLTDAMVAALAAAGVNRASIGVQEIDPVVQRAVNRVQPFETTKSAIEKLRAVGINSLNVDIMFGLPHQTVQHVEKTVSAMVSLRPDRVAVFGYAHVPHMKRHMALIDEKFLPSTEERIAQSDHAQRALIAAGYEPIGLDHFALPDDSMTVAARSGGLRRNFQGYTIDTAPALIGIGASAISSLPQGYLQNETEVPRYRETITSGNLATARGIALGENDRIRRAIIERLMCCLRVDLAEIALQFGTVPEQFCREIVTLQSLQNNGFVEIDRWNISVPASERAAVRLVCAVFDEYLDPAAARHALAV
jgi:oxygen-independent coproporphyrinogen-3 oxidase